jgi:hypothetical protein
MGADGGIVVVYVGVAMVVSVSIVLMYAWVYGRWKQMVYM